MNTGIEVKQFKVKELPASPKSNAIYWVKASEESAVSGYITDLQGVPYPLKDVAGAGGSVDTIMNTDGNLIIEGDEDIIINISPALLSVINSALQSGDNISELFNDADYVTTTDANNYADSKVEDQVVDGVTDKAPSQNAVFDFITDNFSSASKEEFVWTGGSQIFTLSENYTSIKDVFVQGQQLTLSQFNLILPDKVEIIPQLDFNDTVSIEYHLGNANSLPVYTQAQIDYLLSLKEDLANKTQDFLSDGDANTYPSQNSVEQLAIQIIKGSLSTGLMDSDDETFYVEALNSTTLRIHPIKLGIFLSELYAHPASLVGGIITNTPMLDVPLSSLGLINTSAIYIRYVGYDKDLNVVISETDFNSNYSVLQLCYVVVACDGLGNFTFAGAGAVNSPQIAGYSRFERESNTLHTTARYLPNNTNTLQRVSGDLVGMGVGWVNNITLQPSPNIKPIGTLATVAYIPLNPLTNTLPSLPAPQTAISGTQYWNGSAMVSVPGANDYIVKKVLLSQGGNTLILESETYYTGGTKLENFEQAKANVLLQSFTTLALPITAYTTVGYLILENSATPNISDTEVNLFLPVTSQGSVASISAPVVDASASQKGIIQGAGDINMSIGGNATSPMVSGLMGTPINTMSGLLKLTSGTPSVAISDVDYASVANANSRALDANVIHTSGNETRTGSLTSDSFKVPLGLGTQFLKADGSVDSNIYALDNNIVHISGTETITGIKNISNSLGFGTTAPTHPLTLSSTSAANGIAIYNTTDQTTNYERVRQYWSGNNYFIGIEAGGTGIARTVIVKGAHTIGTPFIIQDSAGVQKLAMRSDTNFLTVGSAGGSIGNGGAGTMTYGGNQNVAISVFGGNNGTITFDPGINNAGAEFNGTTRYFIGSQRATTQNSGSNNIFKIFDITNAFTFTGTAANNTVKAIVVNPTLTGVTGTNKFYAFQSSVGGVYINTSTIQDSAILQADSTTQGSLPFPRMTSAQRIAITSPVEGLYVHQTDGVIGLYQYTSGAWVLLQKTTKTRKDITGTTYTLLSSDVDKILYTTNSSPVVITVPSGLTTNQEYEILQFGAGQVSFVASGTTLRVSSYEQPKIEEQYGKVIVEWRDTETYKLFGELSAY